MALQKQPLSINFSQGLDLKSDPWQLPSGKFLSLQNSVFTKAGLLAKRNGYGPLTALPDASNTVITTYNGGLTAIGKRLEAYSSSTMKWADKGPILPVEVSKLALIRNNTSQSTADAAVAPNGLVCTVYTDQDPTNLSNKLFRYAVYDTGTGQNIVPPTTIAGADQTYGAPRVYQLGNYFVVLYTSRPSSYHLRYFKISIQDPSIVSIPADITSSYEPSVNSSFDGIVVGNKLFIAYPTAAGGQSIKITYLIPTSPSLAAPQSFAGQPASIMSLSADITTPSNPIIYATYSAGSSSCAVFAVDQNLNVILAPIGFTTPVVSNIATAAMNGINYITVEVSNNYGYDAAIATHYIESYTISQTGTVTAGVIGVRSVGLASKATIYDGEIYYLAIYNSAYQPTYFLIRQTITPAMWGVAAIISYSNGGSYITGALPLLNLQDNLAQVAFLRRDQIQAANTTQGSSLSPVYAQLGVELASFELGISKVTSSEIGSNLNLSGGYLAGYDGTQITEQGFFLYPDYVEATPGTTGGAMSDQIYYYQFCYEWTDNQGNLFRSAPSVPVGVNVAGGSGAGSVTIDVPTLRLTYKKSSPVRIVGYRWSAAQEVYYQFTSIILPVLNDPTVDYVTIVDTQADASILGSNILYTTGGVLPNLGAHAYTNVCLFDNRLFGIQAEDRNVLGFSRQVIESVPVEMSDYLTVYIAPTTASQGSTGPMTAIAPMDDKLIIYKANALGYINGSGPDNTGANNQYSSFTLINSVVGCQNQQSIVFTPAGLMFQSSGQGIWLLGRDLSTQYIGAPVESLTQGALVQSAVNIPLTTQVRFTLDSGITLMYDYYYGQWGTFNNVPSIYSTVYQNLHTYLDKYGRVFQETPGVYLDNSSPVLMSYTTGWINFAGLQGYERLYQIYLLGQYLTPFKLNIQLAYDYNPTVRQATMVSPDNFAQNYGNDTIWGDAPSWGGTPSFGASNGSEVGAIEASGTVFEARIFPTIQKCESFQVTMNEIYDPTKGQAAGAGLTMSGMSLIIGIVRGFRTARASRSFG